MNFKKRYLSAPALIFAALVLLLLAGLHRGPTDGQQTLRRAGDSAPQTDLSLLGQGGEARFSTAAWRGQAYVVHFFAAWCPDCRTEQEELMTLSASHMPIVGILFKDEPERVTSYLTEAGNPYVAVANDKEERAAQAWGVRGIPTTFLIDSEGIIRWQHAGIISDKIIRNELMPIWEVVKRGG